MIEHNAFPFQASFAFEAEELNRQWQLMQLVSEEMGSATAQVEGLAGLHTVLDVACGVGGWALELAQAVSSLRVTGIDSHAGSIAFARQLAHQRGLANASFLTLDLHVLEKATGPFTPGSVDLIHLAFLAPALLTTDYPALLRTLFQLNRPGGMLLWTEMELPITSSPAFERLTSLLCQALEVSGQSFISPAMQEITLLFAQAYQQAGYAYPSHSYPRRHVGITTMMGGWLRASGYQRVRNLAHTIEVSTGTRAHPAFVCQMEAALRQIGPFLLAQGVLDEPALAQLSSQVLSEIQQGDFCGLCYLLIVCGDTPPSNSETI